MTRDPAIAIADALSDTDRAELLAVAGPAFQGAAAADFLAEAHNADAFLTARESFFDEHGDAVPDHWLVSYAVLALAALGRPLTAPAVMALAIRAGYCAVNDHHEIVPAPGFDPDALEDPVIADPKIRALTEAMSMPDGIRSATILRVMNKAGEEGWSNHQILRLGAELAIRWGVHDPDKNLYRYWTHLLEMLCNVRRHYPNPRGTR
jgi:hypothetical protein